MSGYPNEDEGPDEVNWLETRVPITAQDIAREKIRKARDATAGIDLGL